MVNLAAKMSPITQLMRRMATLAITINCLILPIGLRGSARTAHRRNLAEPALAARVYKIFKLPPGSHPWLPSVARLIAVLPRTDRWTPQVLLTARRAFKRHIADARLLVNALNDGANAVALRDKLLRVLDLSFGYTMPTGKKWIYGSLLQRMELVHLLTAKGVSLALRGHKNRGRRWLIAALLVSCQNDVQRPREVILDGWVRVPLVQGSSTWNAEMQRSHAAFLALFSGPAQQRKLDTLYRLAGRWNRGRFIRNYDAVNDMTAGAIARAKDGSPMANGLLNHLRVAVANATTIYWRFELLRNVLSVRRELNLGGHRRTAKAIKAILAAWGARVKADRTVPKLERSALLRWIKEASI